MGISERHPDVGVPEEAGDDGYGHAILDCVTGHGVAQIVKTHILDSSVSTQRVPQRETAGACTLGVTQRGKHELAPPAELAVEDLAGLGIERNGTRAGLAVVEHQSVFVDFRPAQVEHFALAASGEQKQSDDVRLLPWAGSSPGVFVQGTMQTPQFVP